MYSLEIGMIRFGFFFIPIRQFCFFKNESTQIVRSDYKTYCEYNHSPNLTCSFEINRLVIKTNSVMPWLQNAIYKWIKSLFNVNNQCNNNKYFTNVIIKCASAKPDHFLIHAQLYRDSMDGLRFYNFLLNQIQLQFFFQLDFYFMFENLRRRRRERKTH